MFSGLPEEDATGRNNSGYSFKVDSDAFKESSENKLGVPAAPGAWSPGCALGSRKTLSTQLCPLQPCPLEGGAFLTAVRPDPTLVLRTSGLQPGAFPTVSAHSAGRLAGSPPAARPSPRLSGPQSAGKTERSMKAA